MLSNRKAVHIGITLSEIGQQDSICVSNFWILNCIFNFEIATHMWKIDRDKVNRIFLYLIIKK